MAYIVMAYIVAASIVMAYTVTAYIVAAYTVTASTVTAYTVMACLCVSIQMSTVHTCQMLTHMSVAMPTRRDSYRFTCIMPV